MTHYATRILGDLELARDVVQQTFLKLCDMAESEIGDHTAAWLYTVCRNQALDELRRRRTQPWDEPDRTPADPNEDPAARFEARDLFECLQEIVRRLPAGQREVIDLWADGFSYREISQITENSEGGVRVLAHRALQRLREHPQVKRWADENSRSNGRASPLSERRPDGLCQADRTN